MDFDGVTKKVKSNPLLLNIVLGVLVLANLLNILAFTTTSWGRVYSITGGAFWGFGLWRICSSGTQSFSVGSLCTDTTGWPQDWYGATQSFSIFGFIGISGGLILLILYLCLKQCKGNNSLLFGTGILLIGTGIFYLIGIIIFGAKFDDIYGIFVNGFGNSGELSWSFALAILADLLALLAGALLLIQTRQTRSTSPSKGKAKSTSKPTGDKKNPKSKKESRGTKTQNKPVTEKQPSPRTQKKPVPTIQKHPPPPAQRQQTMVEKKQPPSGLQKQNTTVEKKQPPAPVQKQHTTLGVPSQKQAAPAEQSSVRSPPMLTITPSPPESIEVSKPPASTDTPK